jgi:putative intracellular protease/amidase
MSNHRGALAASLLLMFGSASAMAPEGVTTRPVETHRAAGTASPHAQLMRFLMQPVDDPNQLRGYRIAILAADGVDGFDLDIPRRFLAERGAVVHVVVPRAAKEFQAASSGALLEPQMRIAVLEPSGEELTAPFDQFVDQSQPCEYDLVYLPSNLTFSDPIAERLSLAFLQQIAANGKPIFAMGNATLVLFKAGLINNRTARAEQVTVSLVSRPAAADDAAPWNYGVVYVGRDAFDMPSLMDELIARLHHRPD